MDSFRKPENKPLRPRSYKWALFALSLCWAAMLWFVVRGCLMEGA